MIRSAALRKSAKGQECCLQILNCCNHNPETSVLAHLPDESHGMARKSDDICAVIACDACHAVLDSRSRWPDGEEEHRSYYVHRGMVRTWRLWIEMGLITIKGHRA